MVFNKLFNKRFLYFIITLSILISPSSAEENTLEILEKLKQDVKTLEKAVYSQSSENITSNSSVLSNNDEDVLTRHLLKLSEIEQQFQQLTNKFEEINFKIDKLSSRLSKVQADNQLRFQELEVGNVNNVVTSKSDKWKGEMSLKTFALNAEILNAIKLSSFYYLHKLLKWMLSQISEVVKTMQCPIQLDLSSEMKIEHDSLNIFLYKV